MKQTTQPTNFRRFRLFGWNIYVTRNMLRIRDTKRSRIRTHSKAARLESTGYRCELCGQHITISCHLYHTLPKGMEGRNDFANIRVICQGCLDHVQRVGGYRPMIPLATAKE